jgi:hypothetical protein
MIRLSRKKTDVNKPFSEKVAKRVSKIPTSDLEMWADQCLYELGRTLSTYSRLRESSQLENALEGAEALHAVVNELYKRTSPAS